MLYSLVDLVEKPLRGRFHPQEMQIFLLMATHQIALLRIILLMLKQLIFLELLMRALLDLLILEIQKL